MWKNVGINAAWRQLMTSFQTRGETQCLRCCVTNRKLAGSIPDGVIGEFFIEIILPIALWPWDRLNL